MKTRLVFGAVLLFPLAAAFAADPPAPAKPAAHSLASIHFPPALILHHAEDLNLTAEQRDFVKTAHEEASSQHEAERANHEKQSARLAKMVRDDDVEEEAVLAQLNKVLKSERNMKRLEFELIIRITRNLDADQRAKLPQLKAKHKPIPPEVQKRLETKREKVIADIELLQSSGIPLPDVVELMQSLPPVLKARDFKKAESILDEAIAILGLEKQ